jgi:hypothetical protein
MAPMTDTATPTPPARSNPLASRFDLSDRRNLASAGVLLFCLGVIVGAKLMRGAVPPLAPEPPERPKPEPVIREVPGPVVYRDIPCQSCAEKARQEGEAMRASYTADEAARKAVTEEQLPDPVRDAPRTFSPYAEAVLPAEMVDGAPDTSVPD